MTYVSVDVEASGQYPPKYSLLSIGACDVFNTNNSFYAELARLNDNILPSAQKVVGDLWTRCIDTGLPPTRVMRDFATWLGHLHSRPIFVAFNMAFDWAYIQYYFQEFLNYNPFGISGIDIKAYYMGMMACGWHDTTKKRIKPMFKSKRKHTHNALDDALEQAELFKNLLEFNEKK